MSSVRLHACFSWFTDKRARKPEAPVVCRSAELKKALGIPEP